MLDLAFAGRVTTNTNDNIYRAMLDTGASIHSFSHSMNNHLQRKRPSRIKLSAAFSDELTKGSLRGDLSMHIMGFQPTVNTKPGIVNVTVDTFRNMNADLVSYHSMWLNGYGLHTKG